MIVSPTMKGVLYAFIATLIWSGNFIVSKLLATDIPPVTLAVLRWAVALLFMIFLARRDLRTIMPHLKQYWKYLLLAAFLGITCFNTFIYVAGHTSQAINMSIIASTSPMFTWIFIWALGMEKVKMKNVAAILVAIIGVLFIVAGGDVNRLLHMAFTRGDLWALAAAISFAAYSVSLRFMPKTLPYMAFLVIILALGTLLLLPFMCFEYLDGAVFIWKNHYIWLVLYLSVGMTVIAYLLWIRSVALIGPGNTSMIYYSLPLMTSLEAIVLLNESISFYHVFGALCIVAAIALTMIRNKAR
jgi:drug/metabolite transporter (DMT)-like permease